MSAAAGRSRLAPADLQPVEGDRHDGGPAEHGHDGPVGIDLACLKQVSGRALAVRFAVGAAASLVAGLVSLWLGARWGGLLLAFPAMLPIALVALERHDGHQEAVEDAEGSRCGAIGMVVFALVAWRLLRTQPPALAVGAALAAWAATAIALHLVVEGLRRRGAR